MSTSTKFTLLRNILKTLGLSATAVEEIIQFIHDLLSGGSSPDQAAETLEGSLPYHLRDDFLTPAERSFYLVLRQAVGDWALICPKVSLGDLFYAKTGDRVRTRLTPTASAASTSISCCVIQPPFTLCSAWSWTTRATNGPTGRNGIDWSSEFLPPVNCPWFVSPSNLLITPLNWPKPYAGTPT